MTISAIAQDWQALSQAPPPSAALMPQPGVVELGQMLFRDPRLSPQGLACVACHALAAETRESAPTSRSPPTVWNTTYLSVWFWDGRARMLEEIFADPDHEIDPETIAAVPAYQEHFDAAFGAGAAIDADNIIHALTVFMRGLVATDSAYDRFVLGEQTALSEQQQRGMENFRALGCTGCHMGVMFNGPPMPAGMGLYMKFPTFTDNDFVARYDLLADAGRAGSTGEAKDTNMWRVPSLRNVALTAPYFHNGSVATLDEAVRVMAKVQLNRELSEEEIADLAAFLEGLSAVAALPDVAVP